MKTIFQIRGWICRFFMQYELVTKVIVKFCSYLFIFRQIAGWEGFPSGGILNALSVHMLLALLCVLLPSRFAVFFAIGIVIYNIYQVSLWGALMAAVILLVLYVMIARLCPDETILMIVLPLAIKWELFMIVPLFAGLYMGIFSIIPIVGGVLLWGFMQILPAFMRFNVTELDQLPAAMSDTMSYIADQLFKNESLIFMMIVCSGVVAVIYLLNKLSINYMRYISLVIGALVGLICFIVGKTVGMTDMGIFSALYIPFVSMLIVAFMEFFHMALNYQMAQRLTFADDEYYYYVRAIPKILGIKNKTEVKTITTGRAAAEAEMEEEPKVAPVHRKKPEDEKEEPKVEEREDKMRQATQKIGELFDQVGGKAKNMWTQLKEKATQITEKKNSEIQEEEMPKETEAEETRQETVEEPLHMNGLEEQLPGKESAEELAKRTGWSDETIKDFFAGLDLDAAEAEKKQDPDKQ